MTTYAYDMLGTSLAAVGNGNAEAFSLTAFGDTIPGNAKSGESARSPLPVPQLDRQSICGGGSPFYTGKPNVPGLGHAFLFRNYRASLGKWQTSDPIGYPDGWNQLAYCGNGVASAVDLWGCETILVICANTDSDGVFSGMGKGHSWIEVIDTDANTRTTYGTWGNTKPPGLKINKEKNDAKESCRGVKLNDSQIEAMKNKILEYAKAGPDAWSYTEPCSDFAIAVWLAATGEDLSDGITMTTPTQLKNKIIEKNGGETCNLASLLE